ncbi:MAG: double zinc ribbon domain-containing protein [Eggerthellaceae bacterium]|nr:double zinc ribbon domain-containing protein [Eggerthellaceae bacterium]
MFIRRHIGLPSLTGKAPDGLATRYARALSEVFAESVWPTRCAICDRPGEVLCPRCERSLPYIDHWNACPRCGAPYGRILCSECNPVSLKTHGVAAIPYVRCSCVTAFERRSAAIVTVYKDQGERRLAAPIARMLSEAVDPEWLEGTPLQEAPSISYIPATLAAVRRRGFDHAELLASTLAGITGADCLALFERPSSKDQRKLSRQGRLENMGEGFRVKEGVAAPSRVLLIDDVYTTGATLVSASKALAVAGVEEVYCAAFARVY